MRKIYFFSILFIFFQQGILSQEIFIGEKNYKEKKDTIFIDGLGREVYFRGWNISGAVKLKSMGHKPFKNVDDASRAFRDLRERTGSNIIRYTLSWEAIHPQVDTINYNYLEEITFQIKEAIKNNIYVLLDYHQDLFSRHLFNKNSKFTGNGAPAWITPENNYPIERCFICTHWGMNNIFNKAIKLAFENFWNNKAVQTISGPRNIQDEYFWQMEQMILYLKKNLSQREQLFIIGINPMNEPVHGSYGNLSPNEWYRQKMSPFNKKVRVLMDRMGWSNKFVFAEPLVFWNTNAPTVPAEKPFTKEDRFSKGFVFNSHYYDALRMSISAKEVKNGSYIGNMDQIRKTSADLKRPPFLSEFGMFIKNERVKNQARIIEATYQGMEVSKKKKSNFASFYSPSISGTQWHWDIYHNTHTEPLNGKIITKGDAWNDEDFSIITQDHQYTTPDPYGVERAWPRKCQGRIMHFYYKGRPYDGRKEKLNWMALKLGKKLYLEHHDFFFMVWRGRKSNAPTEIYLPPHFKMEETILMTEEFIGKGREVRKNKNQLLFSSPDVLKKINKSGERVIIWNGKDSFHFILAIKKNKLDLEELKLIQKNIIEMIHNKKSPLFFTSRIKIDKVHLGRTKKYVTY
ncbi:glycoside hydrolase family 5 protein [Bacteriovoracales bacterium]|nr:glycoside hydrolase family 5 protein [Bacteriovoracales bacterium]